MATAFKLAKGFFLKLISGIQYWKAKANRKEAGCE